jgi:cytidyltransferase-like protein
MKKEIKIMTGGGFEIVHAGHIQFFEYLKRDFGNYLIVCISSDRRIKLKKKRIPLNNERNRKIVLLANIYVDEVDVYPETKSLGVFEMLLKHRPDIYVRNKKENHERRLAELDFCIKNGIKVFEINKRFSKGASATELIKRVRYLKKMKKEGKHWKVRT